MASAIGSITAVGLTGAAGTARNTAQIASLQQQLVTYQGQLQHDKSSATGVAGGNYVQLAASQVALVQSEIAQLRVGSVAAGQANAVTAQTALNTPRTPAVPAPSTSLTLGTALNVIA